MERLEELQKAVDAITSNDFCSMEMNSVGSEVGNALEMFIHHSERYIEVADTVRKKIDDIKKSESYPHNFTGQMVEDFEWVLNLME